MKTNPRVLRSSYLPHAPISLRTGVWAILTGVALALPASALIRLLPLPGPDADMIHTNDARMAPLYVRPWWLALHALVIAPLWEEGVYRGLILQWLRRYLPTWLAVAIPTFIFAGIHLTFSYHNAVFAAVVGLGFAWLALRNCSLYPAILCHAGVNLGAVFILRPIFDAAALDRPPAWHEPLGLLLLATSMALLVAGVRVLLEEKPSHARDAVIAPGLAVSPL